MKKCLECECIYPDYYKKCPVCESEKRKEWKQAPVDIGSDINLGPEREIEREEIEIDYDIINGEEDYS